MPFDQKEYNRKRYQANRTEVIARSIKWRQENPEKVQAINRKARYGITSEEFSELLERQNRCCAICLEAKKLNVDHCHTTGKVRGLLCWDCNTSLGKFGDNPDHLRRAVSYLETINGAT